MKILFISDNFPPEVNAPASRTWEHCREWAKAGEQVTVITCAPNFPQGVVYPGYRNRLWSQELIDGIRVIRVWTYISTNHGFIKRIVDYCSFALTGFLAGLFEKADLIITTSPQFFTNFAGWGLSIVKRKPWIFELRDLWPDSILTVGAMKRSKLIDILERMELFFYRKASRIVAVTNAFKQNLKKRGIDPDKIEVIPNGIDPDRFYSRPKNQTLIEQLNLKDKFVVGYIGTHGMAHSLDFIVAGLKYIEDSNIHFLFVGDGAEKKHIVSIAAKEKLKNVIFIDPVPKDLVPEFLGICDVALVPLKKSETFRTVIPSKIFEAAAMQRPILLGVEGQAKEIVDTYKAGVCFEPENREDFLLKVNTIKKDKNLYQSLQTGCEKLAADYQRNKLALKMLSVIYDTATFRDKSKKVNPRKQKSFSWIQRIIAQR
jgi:glycosyltransferase involved in cell wall biosynthesis